MDYEDVKRELLADPATRDAWEDPPLRLVIARLFLERRRALGLSQAQAAAMLGTSQNQVWRIESGDANITVKTLEKLHDTFGLRFTVGSPPGPAAEDRVSASAV